MPGAAASSDDRIPRYRPGTPGSSAIHLDLGDMDGVWTLSFGRFGWKDYETRGAIIRIAGGEMFGGGSNFVYRGTCTIAGDSAIQINFGIDRYRADPNFAAVTGIQEADHFHIGCIIDAITRDHFEGRITDEDRASKDVLPEVKLALMRYGPL